MNVLGTCREALENHKYTKLVEKYDKHTADQLIASQLADANISMREWESYRAVKQKVQNGALNVAKAQKDAESDAALVVSEALT